MKYPAHTYAKALAEAILGSKGKAAEDTVVKNFIALVRKNGDEASLRKIVEEAARMVGPRSGIRKLTIESARELTAAQEKLLKAFVRPGDVVERRIDPNLIAGVKVVQDDELQFDGSLRGKLDKVFNR